MEIYGVICMAINLAVVLVVNILFQNQNSLMDNTRNITDSDYPPMCNHNTIDKDFSKIFISLFTGAENLLDSILFFIYIPGFVTIFIIIIRAKSYLQKLEKDVRLLLVTYTDKMYYIFINLHHLF